ncbi:hypothetical protein G4B88_007830 [Cannabis sativa]|uniref:SUEL-type lectin domain-containing protein n=1 Tax=Cannabis sativa TaxID=3483 RepID=A0A7J6DL08_CANSA|nr:hypothetical protein G4B88_007830 [Cannabis sativa]
MDKSWIWSNNKLSEEYTNGVSTFINLARSRLNDENKTPCPCTDCVNFYYHELETVERHLWVNGFSKSYTNWVYHGEDETASSFNIDDLESDINEDNEDSEEEDDEMFDVIEDITGGNLTRQQCFSNRYHVPRSWFKSSGNILVIFEEKGGDPSKITLSRRKVTGLCALVAEDHPSIRPEAWEKEDSGSNRNVPTVHLQCPENTLVSAVKFASFGTPSGNCGSYTKGDCHDPNSILVVEKLGRKKTNTSETHLNSGSGINHSGLKRRQKVLSVISDISINFIATNLILISPASIVAKMNGQDSICKADLEEVTSLYHDRCIIMKKGGLMGKVASDKCHKWVFKEPTECEPNISNYWQSSFDVVRRCPLNGLISLSQGFRKRDISFNHENWSHYYERYIYIALLLVYERYIFIYEDEFFALLMLVLETHSLRTTEEKAYHEVRFYSTVILCLTSLTAVDLSLLQDNVEWNFHCCRSLSGGQKSRVVFTSISMSKPHILLLDEPTNHLDMQSIDALADALDEFTGGVVLVSHDSRLISRVCEDEEKSEIWVVEDGTVRNFPGTFKEYKEDLQREIKAEFTDNTIQARTM